MDGKWKKNIAALDWNRTGSESTMGWYEGNEVEVEPDLNPEEETPSWCFSLNGVHFGYRRNTDVPDEKVHRLERAEIYDSALVRTDIAHAVVNADKTGRWALGAERAVRHRLSVLGTRGFCRGSGDCYHGCCGGITLRSATFPLQ